MAVCAEHGGDSEKQVFGTPNLLANPWDGTTIARTMGENSTGTMMIKSNGKFRFIPVHPVTLVSLLCLLMTLASSAAQFVDVTAEIEIFDWSYYFLIDHNDLQSRPSNQNASIFDGAMPFHCVIGTNSWFMEHSYTGYYSNQVWQSWFTGTNLISAEKITHSFTNDQGAVYLSGYQDVNVWDMADGNPCRPIKVRDRLMHEECAAWLALCSGPYLKTEARHLYPPFDDWKEMVYAPNGFKDETTVFPDGFGLPMSMNLFARTTQPVFQYRAHLTTNMLGWNFPLEFYMVQYEQNDITNWVVSYSSRGRIKNIRPGTEVEIPAAVLEAGRDAN